MYYDDSAENMVFLGGFDRLEVLRILLGYRFGQGGRQCERMSTAGNTGLVSVELPNTLEPEKPMGSPAWLLYQYHPTGSIPERRGRCEDRSRQGIEMS